jgi:hypothetical protein
VIDAETRKEFDAAIEWLESQEMYKANVFRVARVTHAEYMANFRYDTCPKEGWDDYCNPCSLNSVPKYVTGLPWDSEDEKEWLAYGDHGVWERTRDYYIERGYYRS